MQFSWENEKNRTNKRKHGISFDAAKLVFDDPLHITLQNCFINGEMRWQTIGMINGIAIILVVHTVVDDEHMRLISARKATKQERMIYEKSNY